MQNLGTVIGQYQILDGLMRGRKYFINRKPLSTHLYFHKKNGLNF